MIFVAAGTQDGRELVKILLHRGHQVTASVASDYGESLLQGYEGLTVNNEALDEDGFAAYFPQHGIKVFVDASHPYAAQVSENAMRACAKAGIPYIRYERGESFLDYAKAYYVADYREAAVEAAKHGERIFLTIGAKNLAAFAQAPELADKVLICRILPEVESIQQARELGFLPKHIVAMQGPFSKQMNKEFFAKYHVDVVVTKNSGVVGGADTKFAAAEEMDISLVIIDRPRIAYTNKAESFQQVVDFVEKELG